MRFVNPLTQTLSAIGSSGEEYSKEVYYVPTSLTGVTDESYLSYDADTTYNTGDYVIVPELKTIFRCTADNTEGVYPPSDPSIWVDYGFINSYRMLSTDDQIGSQTKGTDVVMETPFLLSDTVALIDVRFITLLVEQYDSLSDTITDESLGTGDDDTKTFTTEYSPVLQYSETVYINGTEQTRDDDYAIDYATGTITFDTAPASGDDITIDYIKVLYRRVISGNDIGASSFAEYFYSPVVYRSRVILTDLVYTPVSTLRLTFTDSVSIGTFIIGAVQELGVTLYNTELRFEDRSKITTDEITNTRKVIRYGHVRVLNGKVLFDAADFNYASQRVSEIIGKNVLFIPTENDKYGEMSNIAYIETFSLPVDNSKLIESDITLVGVVV